MSDKIAITEKNYLSPKLEPKRYACGNNLYFDVVSETNRSWKFRWQVGGEPFVRGLGPAKLLTPKQAKSKAIKLKKDILANGVPEDTRSGEDASIVRKKFFPFADDWRKDEGRPAPSEVPAETGEHHRQPLQAAA